MNKIYKLIFTLAIILFLVSCTPENKSFVITFETNGGSLIESIVADKDQNIIMPNDPTKEGYTFDGWYLDIESQQAFTLDILTAEDITLYAKWIVNQYTITFDTNGGSEITSITQDYNSQIKKPNEPIKEGYTFLGWDYEIPQKMPANNLNFKALYYKWEVINGYSSPSPYRNSQVLIHDDYYFIQEGVSNPWGPGVLTIYKFSDSSYKREVPASSFKVDNGLIFVYENYLNGIGKLFVYSLEDENYKKSITGSYQGSTINAEIVEIYNDYVFLYQDFNESQGILYIYDINDENYERIIVGSRTGWGSQFGRSVFINDDYIFVSANGYNNYKGAVFIYKFSDLEYEQVLESKTGHSGNYGFLLFENFLIISRGDTVQYIDLSSENLSPKSILNLNSPWANMEAYSYNENLIIIDKSSFHVYTFANINGDWQQKDSYQFIGAELYLSLRVAYGGRFLFISDPEKDDNQGYVYIYDLDKKRITFQFTGENVDFNDYFGYSLSYQNGMLLVSTKGYSLPTNVFYLYDFSEFIMNYS